MLACRRNYTGPLLISAKNSPEASGHWPIVPAPQAQTSTPALAGVSGSHQTLPLAGCDNGPSLPQFPHMENGCSSTHPTPQCSASPWVVLLTLGVFKQVFAASPCSGFIWMVILSVWAAGPSNASQLRGLQLSIPPRVLIHVSHASVQAGREASVAQGMPRLGPCMLWGFPAFRWSC